MDRPESMGAIAERYDAVMALAGEPDVSQDDINAALVAVVDDVKTKAENGINWLNSIDENIAGAKERRKKYDAYIKSLENRKKRMLTAYMYAMEKMGMKSIMTGAGELKLKKNPPALVIDDISKIPSKFEKSKIEISLDKVAIKAAIKAGETIEGCHLEQAISLSY
jgi:hypothetical protein